MNQTRTGIFISTLILCSTLVTSTPHAICGQTVEAWFSPSDNPVQHLITLLQSASQRIYAAVYTFTHRQVAQELVNAQKRGVSVRIIVDQNSLQEERSVLDTVSNAGIALQVFHPKKGSALMHHKFVLVDDHIWTGSLNWTYSASKRNHENVLLIRHADAALRATYEHAFKRLETICREGKAFQAHAKKKQTSIQAVTATLRQQLSNAQAL